jgi:TIR domain
MTNAFMSYSRRDSEVAMRLARALRESGIDTFFDHLSFPTDSETMNAVRDQIKLSDITVMIWSKHAAESEWIKKDILLTLEAWENNRLFLIRLDKSELPVGFRDLIYFDATAISASDLPVEAAKAIAAKCRSRIYIDDKKTERKLEAEFGRDVIVRAASPVGLISIIFLAFFSTGGWRLVDPTERTEHHYYRFR